MGLISLLFSNNSYHSDGGHRAASDKEREREAYRCASERDKQMTGEETGLEREREEEEANSSATTASELGKI